jgi:hypothetical protein
MRWSSWGDALLCTPTPVASLPHLSLEPVFRRGWGSAYAALACGRIDAERLRDLLASHLPDLGQDPLDGRADLLPRGPLGRLMGSEPSARSGSVIWWLRWYCSISAAARRHARLPPGRRRHRPQGLQDIAGTVGIDAQPGGPPLPGQGPVPPADSEGRGGR